MNEKQIDNGEV